MIEINETTSIDPHEIWFEFSHSSGPGGQNVNKVSSQATLCFVPAQSHSLQEWQKRRILERLHTRISREGILRISAREARSQHQNRQAAEERFVALLQDCLKPRRTRRPTRPTHASGERRLKHKRVRAELKQNRKRPRFEDD